MADTSGCENAGNELGHMKRTIHHVAKNVPCRIFVFIRTTTTDGLMPRRCTLTSSRTTSSPVSIKVMTEPHHICQNAIAEPGSKVCTIPTTTVSRVALILMTPFFAILPHTSFKTFSPVTGWGCRVETTALVLMLYYYTSAVL